jgi:hypothetical protein
VGQDLTDQYNTPLTAEEEKAFQSWAKSKGRDLTGDLPVYDMRGFWKGAGSQADNGHFPDTFKKPSHPTFSSESKYHGVDGNEGGEWTDLGNGKWSFKPGATNLKLNSVDEIKGYLSESDPDVQLVLPQVPASVATNPASAAAMSAFGYAAQSIYPNLP